MLLMDIDDRQAGGDGTAENIDALDALPRVALVWPAAASSIESRVPGIAA